jgi:hypothetical protein
VKFRLLLTQVTKKVLGALSNAADQERFSLKLGRMVAPSHASLADARSTRMLFIADYCRVQQRDDVGDRNGESTMRRTSEKFPSRAEAILRLQTIDKNPVAVASDVSHGAVVEVGPSSSLAASSQDESVAEAAGENEPADVDEPAEGGDVAEDVDADGTAD